jgi:hypothetical protein
MKHLDELDCDMYRAEETIEETCLALEECLKTSKKMRSKASKEWRKDVQKLLNDINKIQAEFGCLYEEVEGEVVGKFCKEQGL